MWTEIIKWWQSLWADPTIVGGAVAGFVSALIMFLIGDVIWKSRVERVKARMEFRQKQLDCFYAPLYRFYREAYARFDVWQRLNADTKLLRQPFFEDGSDESFVDNIFAEHPGYASQLMLRQWAEYGATHDKTERHNRRHALIVTLIKEYHGLRQKLDLDYDKNELETGTFGKAA
jgi:hypothetical protein